jgi:hypothetical protein
MAPRIRRGSERVRAAGGRTRNQDCCCDTCCDTEGGPPTADFSYTQTAGNASACTISLHDESVPGYCGSIVAWSWKKNGVEFSTAQHPTGVAVNDADDIELTVTDIAGCTDSAVMEINCSALCAQCTDYPTTCSVTVAGMTNSGCTNNICDDVNGAWSLPLFTVCGWRSDLPFLTCNGPTNARINVTLSTSGANSKIFCVILTQSGGVGQLYTKTFAAGACKGSHTVPLDPFSGSPHEGCGWPASVTVVFG